MTDYNDTDMDLCRSEREELNSMGRSQNGIHSRRSEKTDESSDGGIKERYRERNTLKSVVVVPNDKTKHRMGHGRDRSEIPDRRETYEEHTRAHARDKGRCEGRKREEENHRDRHLRKIDRENDSDRGTRDDRRKERYRPISSSSSEGESDEDLRGAVGGRRIHRHHRQRKAKCDEREMLHVKGEDRRKDDRRGWTKPNIKIKHYDGNTPWEAFLIQFEIGARQNEWTEDQKMAQLQCCLSGKAAQVLWDTDMAEIATYGQLVERLERRFSSASQQERFVEELRSRRRRPGESLSDLHADIRRLFALAYGARVRNADLSEAIARDYFITSLDDPDLEIRVKEKDPAGLDDALKAAIRAETHLRTYERTAGKTNRGRVERQEKDNFRTRRVEEGNNRTESAREDENGRLMQQLMQQVAACQKQTEEISKELRQMRLENERRLMSGTDKKVESSEDGRKGHGACRRDIGMCHACGEKGHFRDKCPSRNDTKNGGNARACYNCGLPGHISRNCPEREKKSGQMEHEPKTSKGITSQEDDRSVYLEVEFAMGKRLALLDTGSEITLFPIGLEGHGLVRKTSQKVMAANGTEIGIIGMTSIAAKVNGIEVEIEGYVTQNVDEVIIGVDILKKWKCIWDFETNSVRILGSLIKLQAGVNQKACRRIVLAEDVVIPPSCEMIVPGTVVFHGGSPMRSSEQWATVSGCVRRGLYVANTVIPDRTVGIPVRVTNTTRLPMSLNAGSGVTDLIPVEICTEAKVNQGGGVGDGGHWSACYAVESRSNKPKLTETDMDDQKLTAIDRMANTAAEAIDQEQRMRLRDLLISHSKAFSFSETDLGCTKLIEHQIDTGNARPCKQRLRRQPPAHEQEIKRQIDVLLAQGAIEPTQSPWASNVVMVRKKDGSYRMCIDYRALNDLTKKDSYSMVRIDAALDALNGSMWFTTLDLRSSYHQILVSEPDRDKTAWISKFGQYRYVRMPFGLSNAGATFQRLIDLVLSGLSYSSCLAYIDDIIIFSRSVEQHWERLSCVLQRIIDAGLKCRPDKCVFLRPSVEFLGHVVSAEGVAVLPARIEAVSTWPRPGSLKEVREWLGLVGYYRRHVERFAHIARPLTDMLKGDCRGKFTWSDEAEESFERLKTALVTSPVLAMPNEHDEFVLDTDASLFAIGAVLSQVQDGVERVIAYGSKRLKRAESNYCTTRRELWAVVHFVRQYRCYLLGRKFRIRSDHAALVWLRRLKEPVGQQARWLEELENYDYHIEHRAGNKHTNADVMSRKPVCDRKDRQRKCPVCDGDAEMDGNEVEGLSELRWVGGIGAVQVNAEGRQEMVSDRILDAKTMTGNEKRCRIIETMDNGELRDEQIQDGDVGWIYGLIQNGKPKPKWSEVAAKSAEAKALWTQWDRLQLRGGVLMRKYEAVSSGEGTWQIVLPKSQRMQFVKETHEGFSGAHLGRNRTEASIRRRAYWPGWTDTVDVLIKCCAPCAQYSREKPPRQVSLTPIMCGEPFEVVSIDITGPHPVSTRGHAYILTVVDHFSRWAEAYPIRKHTAETVAGRLFEQWYSRFGFPLCLLSDLGPEMESNIMKELCRLAHVDKIRTCAYSPRTNGKSERFHKVLNEMLAKCVASNQKDWDQHLPFVTAAYRSTKHESTQFTPNRIVLGRETRAPIDLMYYVSDGDREPITTCEYVREMTQRMQDSYELVRKFSAQAAERMKVKYDRGVKPAADLKMGQRVLYYYPRRFAKRSPKWQSMYVGPFQVIKQIDDHRVIIRKNERTVPIVVGRDKLKTVPDGMGFNSPDRCFGDRSRKDQTQNGPNKRVDKTLEVVDVEMESNTYASDSEERSVGVRNRRSCGRPKYLNDYISCRYIYVSDRVPADKEMEVADVRQSEVPSLKPVQCECGSRFTTKKGRARHRRMVCVFTKKTNKNVRSTGVTTEDAIRVSAGEPRAVETTTQSGAGELGAIGREIWRDWLEETEAIDASAVSRFMGDRLLKVPENVRAIVLQWIAGAVNAALESRKRTGARSDELQSDDVSISSAGKTTVVQQGAPIRRVRRITRIVEAPRPESAAVSMDVGYEGGAVQNEADPSCARASIAGQRIVGSAVHGPSELDGGDERTVATNVQLSDINYSATAIVPPPADGGTDTIPVPIEMDIQQYADRLQYGSGETQDAATGEDTWQVPTTTQSSGDEMQANADIAVRSEDQTELLHENAGPGQCVANYVEVASERADDAEMQEPAMAEGRTADANSGQTIKLEEEVRMCSVMFFEREADPSLLQVEYDLFVQGFFDRDVTVERIARLVLAAYFAGKSEKLLVKT